jgi:hypothetical protein
MKLKLRNKARAAGIHLMICLIAAAVAAALVYLIWHPSPIDRAVGVSQIFLIVLAVDICLGPLLTFIVYSIGKPSLRFDLTVIALIQISALLYGLSTVFSGRPVFIAFTKDRFELVRMYEVDSASLSRAKPPFDHLSLLGPLWATARAPTDPKTRNDLLFSSLSGGPDLQQLPEYFEPLSSGADEIKAHILSLSKLTEYNKKNVSELNQALVGLDDSKFGYLPLRANATDMSVIVERSSGKVRAIVDLRPWDQ